MELYNASHRCDESVKQLLDRARSAVNASDAQSALQCVAQALQLIRGDDAVLPTLRNAAEQFHAERKAPIEEISALLSQVTLQAEQQQATQWQQHQQQPHRWPQPAQPHVQQQSHYQQQLQGGASAAQQPVTWQLIPHPQYQQLCKQQHQAGCMDHQQQQLPQQCMGPGTSQQGDHMPILDETGRGDLAGIALQDGLHWQCPHCAGVLPQQRQQAHLETWCPALHRSSSDDMQQ